MYKIENICEKEKIYIKYLRSIMKKNFYKIDYSKDF